MNSKNAVPIVAAFDFDGTLTYGDTLIPFLIYEKGFFKSMFYFFLLTPRFIRYLFRKETRQTLKEALLTQFLKGKSYQNLLSDGERFSKKWLPLFLNSKRIKCLQHHLNHHHRCVLISASIEPYLLPWSQTAGFSNALTSLLDVDEEGNVTGKLKGENCRGEEKVRRLETLLGPKSGYILYAYGDSEGDQELLELADHPTHF